MKTRAKLIVVGTLTLAAAAGTTAVVSASSAAEHEQPITRAALAKASAAALAHTGQGRVSETEIGDEESLYEVEVTLDDGSQVDVQLDDAFKVVGTKADKEDPGSDR